MLPIDWPRQTPERMVGSSLQDAANLRDFLTNALPELVAGFDFARLRPVPLTFLGDDWRGREADLLFELPYVYDGGAATTLVCLLLEHQTNTDRLAALRTLYCLRGILGSVLARLEEVAQTTAHPDAASGHPHRLLHGWRDLGKCHQTP